jgi:DNA repair protein RecO (recombination protein O)
VVDLMGALWRGEWAFVETTSDSVRRQCGGLVAAHLQWHLERQLRTLPLLEREGRGAAAL